MNITIPLSPEARQALAQDMQAATSHVANGVTCVLRGLEAAEFVWDSGASLWFALGDAQ